MLDSQNLSSPADAAPVLTVIQHQDSVPLGLLAEALPGMQLRVVRPDAGQELPDADRLDGLVVLGGTMSVLDVQDHPWLTAERELLDAAVGHGVPTLAVCLGAQQLAVARGGQVEVGAPTGPERGVVEVRMRPDAAADPVLGPVVAALGRDVPAPSMHGDAITALPAEATWLASSQQYPFQAFRLGSAVGVQFHPEASPERMAAWAERRGDDGEAMRREMEAVDAEVATVGEAIARAFADVVRRFAAA